MNSLLVKLSQDLLASFLPENLSNVVCQSVKCLSKYKVMESAGYLVLILHTVCHYHIMVFKELEDRERPRVCFYLSTEKDFNI